jgi:hypothetical protein
LLVVLCSQDLLASAGPPIQRPLNDEQILARISGPRPDAVDLKVSSSERLLRVKSALTLFASSANPRYLGDVQRELALIPNTNYSADFYLNRASLRQSLHQFDSALSDLDAISTIDPDNRQAILMRFSIAFVSGQYSAAGRACEDMLVWQDLYSASCQQHLRAIAGSEIDAYQNLKQAMANNGPLSDRQALLWASGTLADIAERAALDDEAAKLWSLNLRLNKDDHYARTRLAALKLMAGDNIATLDLSQDYLAIDALAVLHAIASKRVGGSEAVAEMLRLRFAEALWRGEVLHKRAYAQFLLFVEAKPKAAYEVAKDNWRNQKELPDAGILEQARAAINAGGQQ